MTILTERPDGVDRSKPLEPAFRIRLLDNFEFFAGGQRIELPGRCQRIVAYLALRGRPTRRTSLITALWPDKGEKQANACLRSALWRLNRLARGVIESSRCGATVGLIPSVRADVVEARELAQQLLRNNDPTIFEYRQTGTFDELTTELLPGWYEDWVLAESEAWLQLRVRALEALAALHGRDGRYAEALRCGLAAVQGDPLRESAHVSVIKVYLLESNKAEAVRHYEYYRRMLLAELDLVPGPALTTLIREGCPIAGDAGVTVSV